MNVIKDSIEKKIQWLKDILMRCVCWVLTVGRDHAANYSYSHTTALSTLCLICVHSDGLL